MFPALNILKRDKKRCHGRHPIRFCHVGTAQPMSALSTEENLAVPGEQWGGHHRDEKNPEVSLEGSSVTTIKLPEGVSKERVPLRVTPGWCNRVAVLVLARQASLNFPKNKNKSLPWWPARGSGWGKLTPPPPRRCFLSRHSSSLPPPPPAPDVKPFCIPTSAPLGFPSYWSASAGEQLIWLEGDTVSRRAMRSWLKNFIWKVGGCRVRQIPVGKGLRDRKRSKKRRIYIYIYI